MKSVVIIEDQDEERFILETIAQHEGFTCTSYSSAESFFNSEMKHVNCIFLIDWNLPGIKGPDIIKTIRARDSISPIFIISGVFWADAISEGLKSGADDFITKPFNPDHLAIKLRNQKAKLNSINDNLINVGLRLFSESGMIIKNGNRVSLTSREFDVFNLLHLHNDKICSRKDILSVFPEKDSTGRKIDVLISSIRKKVSLLDLNIKTIRGEGYQLESKKRIS
jgi:DNA-binding response OmpR family regulator